MSRRLINAHCGKLPGAEVSDPWGGGHDCWKVGGKMFASMGVEDRGLSLKCPDESMAAMLIESGRAQAAPYLKRGGWVFVPWGSMEPKEIKARVTASYLTVRRSLTRALQATLGPEPK